MMKGTPMTTKAGPLDVYIPGDSERAIRERQQAEPERREEWAQLLVSLMAEAGAKFGRGPGGRRQGFSQRGTGE